VGKAVFPGAALEAIVAPWAVAGEEPATTTSPSREATGATAAMAMEVRRGKFIVGWIDPLGDL
jgi:hypothetical protein